MRSIKIAGTFLLMAFAIQFCRAEQAEPLAPTKSPNAERVQSALAPSQGTMPFSNEPDTYEQSEHRIFPLLREKMGPKLKEREKELPPPFGVMFVTNWMDSDWRFQYANISLDGSNPISLNAASEAT